MPKKIDEKELLILLARLKIISSEIAEALFLLDNLIKEMQEKFKSVYLGKDSD